MIWKLFGNLQVGDWKLFPIWSIMATICCSKILYKKDAVSSGTPKTIKAFRMRPLWRLYWIMVTGMMCRNLSALWVLARLLRFSAGNQRRINSAGKIIVRRSNITLISILINTQGQLHNSPSYWNFSFPAATNSVLLNVLFSGTHPRPSSVSHEKLKFRNGYGLCNQLLKNA